MRSLFLKLFLWFFVTIIAGAVLIVVSIIPMFIQPQIRGFLKMITLLLPVITLGLGAFFCFLVTRHITSLLFLLSGAAEGIAGGNLAVRVSPRVSNRRDEIGVLGRDFNRMAERIESLVEGHKRLLGDVSHELRSPLSRLVVALGLARKAEHPDIPEHLDRINLEANRLDHLIGQLLTLSRIESRSHDEPRTRVDLANLVDEIVSDADFEARAQAKTVVVRALQEGTVTGSEEQLRSALENVIRNAVRFTREGTPVEVSLQRADGTAVLRIRDHGPGVPEAMLSEIFLPFRRVSSPAGVPTEGSGLGLAIAQRAIAAHGGTIHAKNAPDGGLIVEIVLLAER